MKLRSKPIRSGCIIMLTAAFILLWPASRVEAATVCSPITSLGFSSAYVPANLTTNITMTSFTVTCARNGGFVGTRLMQFYVAASDGGNNIAGTQNRAKLASFINYDVYADSGCLTEWTGATTNALPPSTSPGAMTLTNTTPSSSTINYWGCIPASQLGLPTGTYTDSVTMTLHYRTMTGGGTWGGWNTAPGVTFPVSIYTPSSCTLTTPPGNVAFTYTSFQIALAAASTTFGVTCTSLLPYTMALDATAGTLPATGLAYTLALSAASGTGTGVAQSFSINGSMVAGQGGTCAVGPCADTQARTLTITY